ncbi:MAG: DUF4215 domain-containing protein [Candidatus Binatia bacterium]
MRRVCSCRRSPPAADRIGGAFYIQDAVTCPAAVCGNGVVEPNEECDDGNTADGDACPATCVR